MKVSIEQKARAYDEAIEKFKPIYDLAKKENRTIDVKEFEDIFPELKESEDDRIRKELIEFFTFEHWDGEAPFSAESARERIAWLEKLGEQKPVIDIDIPFGANDSELQEVTYYIPKGFHAEIDDDKVVIKKGEKDGGSS